MDGHERLSSNGYKAVSIFSGFLFVAGSCTQLITLVILLKREYRKNILTPFFLSIIVSNFLLLYGSLPTTFVSSLKKGWIFNDKICHLVGFLSGTGSISMIATMAVITVKIYLLVKNKTFAGNQIKPDNSQGKVLVGVWLYSICAMLPPLTGITEMSIEGSGTNCVPQWSPKKTSGRIYIAFLLSMAYIIPVSVSAIYLAIVRKKVHHNINATNYYFHNLCFRNLRNINKMCIFAVIFFSVSWLPYAIVVIICMFGKKSFITPEMEMVPTLLAKTSAVFNPFIYAAVNPRFRNSVLELLRIRLFCCDDEEEVVGDVNVLNSNIKHVRRTTDAESEHEKKDKMDCKALENKPEVIEAAAKSNASEKSKESCFTTSNSKRSCKAAVTLEEQGGNGLCGKTAIKYRSDEKYLNKNKTSSYKHEEIFIESGTSSKESNEKAITSSSITSHYLSDTCSNFLVGKRLSKKPPKQNSSPSFSSSSTLNVSVAYRAYRTVSSEINSQSFTIPGSVAK